MPLLRLFRRVWGRQPEGKFGLAVMAGESIYANFRLRLTANRTYDLMIIFILCGCFLLSIYAHFEFVS
jgi:hypothetical protein